MKIDRPTIDDFGNSIHDHSTYEKGGNIPISSIYGFEESGPLSDNQILVYGYGYGYEGWTNLNSLDYFAVLGVVSSDFAETVDDRVASLIQNGTDISWTYVDELNALTPNNTSTLDTVTDRGNSTTNTIIVGALEVGLGASGLSASAEDLIFNWAGSEVFRIKEDIIAPVSSNQVSLGSSFLYWATAYIVDTYLSGGLIIGDTLLTSVIERLIIEKTNSSASVSETKYVQYIDYNLTGSVVGTPNISRDHNGIFVDINDSTSISGSVVVKNLRGINIDVVESGASTNTGGTVVKNITGVDSYVSVSGSKTGASLTYNAYGYISNVDGNSITNHGYGLYSTVSNTVDTSYAVYGSNNSASTQGYGGYFKSQASPVTGYGVYADSTGSGTTNYGIYATASGASTNYSAYFSLANVVIDSASLKIINQSAPGPQIIFAADTGSHTLTFLDSMGPFEFSSNLNVTGSLVAVGSVTGTGVLTNAGSAAAPSFRFSTDTNTGIYGGAADQINFSTGGTSRAYITTSAIQTTVNILPTATGTLNLGSTSFRFDTFYGEYLNLSTNSIGSLVNIERISIANPATSTSVIMNLNNDHAFLAGGNGFGAYINLQSKPSSGGEVDIVRLEWSTPNSNITTGTGEFAIYVANGAGWTPINVASFHNSTSPTSPAIQFGTSAYGFYKSEPTVLSVATNGAEVWEYQTSLNKSLSQFEVEGTSNPIMILDQNTDSAVSFINFEGTTAASTAKPISTLDAGATGSATSGPSVGTWNHTGMLRIKVNGIDMWVPYYVEL